MTTETWLASGFGIVSVAMIGAVAIWITARDRQPPQAAIFIFRVIIALSAAGVGAVLPGMLDVSMAADGLTIRAACGFGLFVVIYLLNPPGRLGTDLGPTEPRVGPIKKGSRKVVGGP
jgi:hypothetical protein